MRKLARSAAQPCGMVGAKIQTVTSTGIRVKMKTKQSIQRDDSTVNSGGSSFELSPLFC